MIPVVVAYQETSYRIFGDRPISFIGPCGRKSVDSSEEGLECIIRVKDV